MKVKGVKHKSKVMLHRSYGDVLRALEFINSDQFTIKSILADTVSARHSLECSNGGEKKLSNVGALKHPLDT